MCFFTLKLLPGSPEVAGAGVAGVDHIEAAVTGDHQTWLAPATVSVLPASGVWTVIDPQVTRCTCDLKENNKLDISNIKLNRIREVQSPSFQFSLVMS